MFFSIKNYSQNQSTAIGLFGGYSENGAAALLNYNYYTNRENFIQGGIYYSVNKIEKNGFEIPFNIFTLNVGYFDNIYTSLRKNIKVNIGGGPVVGYEVLNNGDNTLDSGAQILDKSQFIYGGFLSAEIDLYLSNDFSFIIKANEYYHVNSDIGQFTLFAGIGFRYFIY